VLAGAYERKVSPLLFRASDRLIAVSRAVALHARRLGAQEERIVLVPNGVDLVGFAPAERKPFDGKLRVVFVGRLIFNKGPQYLVRAAARVLAQRRDVEFLMVGDGPMRSQLERMAAELGVGDALQFLGLRKDVPEILAGADIFVRPSLLEGMPLTVLEAMACGLPVVATRIAGTVEVVEEGATGFLVEPGNITQLADRLCVLLEDGDLRREMGQRGRMLVESGHDWDDIAQQTARVYQELLAS
jgi:glycosyltransferase involved in cell wall biosynthesis